MSSRSFETAVKGATKVKLAPPKRKYIEAILSATQSGEAGVAEIFRTLTNRLRDSTWTVVFKSLIVVHLMIQEGARDVTLNYLSAAPSHRLAINSFTNVQTQGQNIRKYTDYLVSRAKAYEKIQRDHVQLANKGHFKSLSVDKGLLRESEIVLDQIKALTRCNMLDTDIENEISLTAFRLLTSDLLDLFAIMNEAVMAVLQHYFEMSRPDAERAVKIYRKFCTCTEQVVSFLRVAQQHQHAMRLEIPKLKHAPIDLANTLQEYLDDKDFDINRRQYLAQQEGKRTGKPTSTATFSQSTNTANKTINKTGPVPAQQQQQLQQPAGPAPDLIDFFESIESNQQPMAQNAAPMNYAPTGYQQAPQVYQQQQQFIPQQQTAAFTNDASSQFMPQTFAAQPPNGTAYGNFSQPQQTFAATNEYTQNFSQPQQDAGQAFSPIQPQATNPFRKSVMQSMPTGQFNNQFTTSPLQPQNTNPFARSTQQAPQVPQLPQSYQTMPQQTQPLQAQRTGTNPFAHTAPQQQQQQQQPQQAASPLQMQPTGSTNPFRQSTFVNQNTGSGWQNMQQPTMGGLEHLPTMPVFPRPGQQQPQSSPWS